MSPKVGNLSRHSVQPGQNQCCGKKRIAILGSTGSIGTQALEVISAFPEKFSVVGLSADHNVALLAQQVEQYRPSVAAMMSQQAATELGQALQGSRAQVAGGVAGLVEVATWPEADLVLAAISGVAGLVPVLRAVEAGKQIALANKEPLVVAGQLLTESAQRSGAALIPVDSEHSAIFQALMGQERSKIQRLILTASGGPFAQWPLEKLAQVTAEQALHHPTWKMGKKVTIDSATLMNKGLEVIEAHWLFGVEVDRIEIVIHHQSIVHSLVEFVDGSVLAQLGIPDMKTPLQFALGYPERLPKSWGKLDLAQMGRLTFAPPDLERFPCVRLAYRAVRAGGTMPAALNAADEVAVAWFLAGKIGFLEIPKLIERAMDKHQPISHPNLEEIVAVDREIRDWLEGETQPGRPN